MDFIKGLVRLTIYWVICAVSLLWLVPSVNCWAGLGCDLGGKSQVWGLAAIVLAIHFFFVIASCNFQSQLTYALFALNYVFIFFYVWFITCTSGNCAAFIPLIIVGSAILLHWLVVGRFVNDMQSRHSMADRLPSRMRDPNSEFSVIGPQTFIGAFDRLYAELKYKAPDELETLMSYLPQATYRPHLPVSGMTDGRFSLDGTDYDALRFAVLHQVGHCLYGKSESLANKYANSVLKRIEAKQFKGKMTCKYVPHTSIGWTPI